MRSMAFLAVALITFTGAVQAQNSQMPMPNSQMPNQAQMGGATGACGHTATITDEYHFRYDAEGNRLDGRGCVIAPPVTPPGAKG
jgi:hypothetical protein